MNSHYRKWIVAAISIAITVSLVFLAVGSAPRRVKAQTPPTVATNEPPDKERAEFAEYRSWKPVGEPVRLPDSMMVPCGPRVDLNRDPGIHGSKYILVYVNPTGRQAFTTEKLPKFAEGTVIVKEKLKKKDDRQPHELAIMVKREKGFDPRKGDWQFMFVDEDNEFIRSKQMPFYCAGCHSVFEKTDYVSRKSWTALDFRKTE